MTILLVDSDKDALERETKRLAEQQFAVTASLHSNADDAIKFAMYHDVDIVFTRDVLAEMTGQDLIDKIHSFKPETECHILQKNEKVPFNHVLKASKPSFSDVVPYDHTILEADEAEKRFYTDQIKNRQSAGSECSLQTRQKEGDAIVPRFLNGNIEE